jgi:hypothetical protein
MTGHDWVVALFVVALGIVVMCVLVTTFLDP